MANKAPDPMKGTKKKETSKGPHGGGNKYHSFTFGEGFENKEPTTPKSNPGKKLKRKD